MKELSQPQHKIFLVALLRRNDNVIPILLSLAERSGVGLLRSGRGWVLSSLFGGTLSIQMEHLLNGNGDGRVIGIHLHNVRHVIPPTLRNFVGTHVL